MCITNMHASVTINLLIVCVELIACLLSYSVNSFYLHMIAYSVLSIGCITRSVGGHGLYSSVGYSFFLFPRHEAHDYIPAE